MTDKEHRKLNTARRLDLLEPDLRLRAFKRARAGWIWISLLALVFAPLAAIPPLLFWRALQHHPFYFLSKYWPAWGGLVALLWIGYCTAKITVLNDAFRGNATSAWQRIGIFAGLLLMNVLIGLVIGFAGCIMIPGGNG